MADSYANIPVPTPTQNPVPSADIRDHVFGGAKIDEFVTSLVNTYVDRFGTEHYTIEGLRWLAQQAIAAFGWVPAGTFQAGATLTLPNQILKDTASGEYYRWDGALPKTVPSGSTPSSAGGVGVGAWISVGDSALRSMLQSREAEQGASMIGWKRQILKSVISSTQGMLDAQPVNVWEFADLITLKPDASKPETWDWTPAFQASINSVAIMALDPGSNGGCVVIPAFKNGGTPYNQGVYKITQVDVPLGVAIQGFGATVSPYNQADSRTHLFKFAGVNKVSGLQIAMNYSLTYDCAIWCVGPDSGGRNSDFSSCAVWFSKNAVTIGDPAWLTNIADGWRGTSELSFTNCQFNWCLRTATMYGQNSIAVFGGGSRCYANRGSIPSTHPNAATWLTAPMGNFLNYGGLIYVVGAFIGTFERDTPSLTARVMPSNTTDYVNSYGRYYIEGCHIETSFLYYAPGETSVSADVITKALVLHNCHGHIATSPADTYWISASAQLMQGIDVRSCGFYGTAGSTPTRTKLLSATGCPVHISKDSFNVLSGEFKDANTFPYPSDFSNIMLVNAFGSNQAISTASTTLIMPSNGSTDLNNSTRSYYYSVSTGNFTAAVELNNVELTLDLRYATPASANQVTVDLVVSGATVDTVVMVGGYPRATLRARRIPKGATFLLRMVGSSTYTLNGSTDTKLSLVANV